MSLGRTSTALAASFRRLAAHLGKAKAITATARRLAVLVYRVLSGDLVYNDPGATAYHQLNCARELKSLRKRAKLLGFELVNHPPARYSYILFLEREIGPIGVESMRIGVAEQWIGPREAEAEMFHFFLWRRSLSRFIDIENVAMLQVSYLPL